MTLQYMRFQGQKCTKILLNTWILQGRSTATHGCSGTGNGDFGSNNFVDLKNCVIYGFMGVVAFWGGVSSPVLCCKICLLYNSASLDQARISPEDGGDWLVWVT